MTDNKNYKFLEPEELKDVSHCIADRNRRPRSQNALSWLSQLFLESDPRSQGRQGRFGILSNRDKTEHDDLASEAHFNLDRTPWRISYGSARFFENLGMHLVSDLISFQVKIVTCRR